MKELKVPWMHWHSQGTPIQDDILAPADPLRTDSLYQSTDLKGAEDLELIVRAGIARWTRSRFEKFTVGGVLQRAPDFLRHLLTTTTVNLTSALQPSASLQPMEALRLPTTFFVDSDRLVTTLGLTPALPRLKTQASFYQATLQTYDVRVQDESGFSRPGDTHFAFAVPEPAFEDEVVLQELLSRRALSKKLAACLLMVDFPNPVFSLRREALLRYVPGTIALDGGADLDHTFVDAVIASPARLRRHFSPERVAQACFQQKAAGGIQADRGDRPQARPAGCPANDARRPCSTSTPVVKDVVHANLRSAGLSH
jgi:hypothetical protein